jgi:hypothetical protein
VLDDGRTDSRRFAAVPFILNTRKHSAISPHNDALKISPGENQGTEKNLCPGLIFSVVSRGKADHTDAKHSAIRDAREWQIANWRNYMKERLSESLQRVGAG